MNTQDIAATFEAATAAGATVESPPERLDRWPVTIAFVQDPDGYLVELVERDPWPDTDPADGVWLGQYCLNVTDIEQTIAFYERLGLTCTSRTEIPHAHEAILEQPGQGGKLQLAQQHDLGGPLEMGSMWKLYVYTDDVEAAAHGRHRGRRTRHWSRRCGSTGGRSRSPSWATPTATRSSSCNGTPTGDR